MKEKGKGAMNVDGTGVKDVKGVPYTESMDGQAQGSNAVHGDRRVEGPNDAGGAKMPKGSGHK